MSQRRTTGPSPRIALLALGLWLTSGASVSLAQTPGLPAAAEPTAPASTIGPPVQPAPVTTTPASSTPSGASATTTLPPMPMERARPASAPTTPVPAPRG